MESSSNVYVGLGSNVGDRLRQLAKAHVALERAGLCIQQASPVFETPPWGKTDQPAFLNQVLRVATALPPGEVMETLLWLETQLGRTRTEKWGPRSIDLDLLAHGDMQVASERLVLPHPGIAERAFVLVPWAAIAPAFVVPGLNRPVATLLRALPPKEREAVRPIG